MPVDVEIVAGGVWLRLVGPLHVDATVNACLAAAELKGFVAGGRLLVDAREAEPEIPPPDAMKRLVERDIPRVLQLMPDWGLLTVDVEQWELGREVVRRSHDLESVEFFNDLASGLRWLTDTQ